MSLEILREDNLALLCQCKKTTEPVSCADYLLETELLLSLKSHDGPVIAKAKGGTFLVGEKCNLYLIF